MAMPIRGDGVSGSRPAVEQFHALTSLRFLAALLVLLFHFAGFFPGALPPLNLIALGHTGVSFFFVLSGFILAHNYASADLRDPVQLRSYFAARIARILPVYLFALAFSLPMLALEIGRATGTLDATLKATSLLLAPLALHAWVPGAACAFNCPTWTISAEAFFYLVLPFVLAPIMRNPARWCRVILPIWGLAILTAASIWAAWGSGASPTGYHQELAHALASQLLTIPPLRLPEFLLGILTYSMWMRHHRAVTTPRALMALLLALCIFSVMLPHVPQATVQNGLIVLVWVPLIVLAASMRQGPLSHPVLVFLGRISFCLYLLHVPIAIYLLLAVNHLFGHQPEWTMALMLSALALCLLAAAWLHLRLEEPARPHVARWFKHSAFMAPASPLPRA